MTSAPGKTILITGASSGLGAALALAYAGPGVMLGLLGRDADRLEHVADLCRENGARVTIGIVDVTDADVMLEWIAAFDRHQPIDLCIANAGVSAGTAGGPEDLAQVKQIMAVNVDGVLHTIHPVLTLMQQRGHGQVAIISSMAGWVGLPGAPAYGMSKAAVRIYGQSLRGLYARFGIQVNVVCPGFVKTPMTDVNAFHMPFLTDADTAAQIIQNGLALNRGLIAFPIRMYIVTRLLSMLPDPIVTWLGRKLPQK